MLIMFLLALLGGILVILTLKKKVKGRLKKFLMLTGLSVLGFVASVILHNLFYGLAVIAREIVVLSWLMKVFDVGFFMVGIFICPVGFLIGVIGSAVLFMRKREEN